MASTLSPPLTVDLDDRGLGAPELWPTPACVIAGRVELRWDPHPGRGVGDDRRYALRLLDLRTHEIVASGEVRGTRWVTPDLPPGGVFELCLCARETLPDGTTASSAPVRRRFRTRYLS